MNCPTFIQYLGKLTGCISPVLLIAFILPAQLLAQPSPVKISLKFPSGDSRGTPASTIGGGRRGVSCINLATGKPSVTALMPKRNNKSLTISDSPTLYFYVPQTTATTGEFILRNDKNNDIYNISFELPQKPGIIHIKIPPTAKLKTGKAYKWYFLLVCDPEDRSSDEYTEGIIERTTISSSLNKYFQQAKPLKQAEIYAKNDLWPETITKVAQLRTQQPKEWEELLKSVGLEVIAKEPLLECCQPNPQP
ncbi:DUF928 domain-containing protein [Sphaerospermopsis aphanizomenoides BCCUSP55]|uniref:DUF928 domain-containing protein n=1 Tax=Sphaerospermopsis aphanizomenoides TaxID=459663 RepID=UPI001903FEB9|nr:DUF928 domain-containing protein [Sphaerospermopsis aphanizomenoides]MBK1986360.1 DUF928 domain-containing protein [Sphaerospermopsis aphanizomenoides BCCUSP55]